MSEQIFKTQQNYKRVNKAKLQFQSSYAVYYKQPRSSREGKPFPYKVMRYIQDSALKTGGYGIRPNKNQYIKRQRKIIFYRQRNKNKNQPNTTEI